jgi:hypothetical protein
MGQHSPLTMLSGVALIFENGLHFLPRMGIYWILRLGTHCLISQITFTLLSVFTQWANVLVLISGGNHSYLILWNTCNHPKHSLGT